MHLSQSKLSLVTLLIVATATAIASPARADGRNEVRAVTFDEDSGGVTRVHVRAATTPTFTVYKLERPSRVVIDVPQATLAEAVRGAHESAASFTAGTWAVGSIAAQQLEDGGNIVRVIVTLARPGRYDVKTEGNELIVMVMPRDAKPATASPADLAAAQAQAAQAKQGQAEAERASAAAQGEIAAAKLAAASAQSEAQRLRKAADDAQRAVEQARQQTARNAATTADVERAKAQLVAAQAAAVAAQTEADRTRKAADKARADALADAAAAKDDASRSHAEADAAKRDAQAAKAQAAQAMNQMNQAVTDVAAARNDVAAARNEAQQARHDAEVARAEAERAKATAAADKKQADAEHAQAEKMLRQATLQVAALDQRTAAAQDMQDKARAAAAAAEAREQAAAAAVASAATERHAAELAARQAAAARDQSQNQAKSERDRLTAEAAAAEGRLAEAKRLADAADARRAQAEAGAVAAKRDLDHSKTALATVEQQRTAAETAASDAARKRSEAEAAAGDAARRRGDAEAQRKAAELAASDAARKRSEAEVAASDAGRKRNEAEAAAGDAARKRSEAEAAAGDATRRRGDAEAQRKAAELAAADATQRKSDAEAQRKAAEDAARVAQAAAAAADKQRMVSETAAKTAQAATQNAEASLAQLTAKRAAAERAATELETRSKAEAAAQAELIAAKARKAGDDVLAQARTEAAKMVAERKAAEDQLATSRKAVASQQSEVDRLRTAASEARDAADREENRRAQLAEQRISHERELAQIKAGKLPPPQVALAAPPPPPPAGAPNATVKAIDFRGDNAGGEVDIAMTGNAAVQVGEVTATYAELIIDGADLATQLERKLDVSKFGSPVRAVSSFRDRRTPNRVRLIAELTEATTPTFDRNGNTVRWSFAGVSGGGDTAQLTRHPHTQQVAPTVVGGFGAASTAITEQSVTQVPPSPTGNGHRRIYHGATVDFDFKDAPIHDLLRIIADTGHVSIVIPDDIEAKVTVRLQRVPWDQALEVILQSHGLWYRREGNIYRISTRKQIDAEDEAEAARREAAIKAEAPEPEIITLNYASAEELKTKMDPLLSPKGKISVDPRTNSLIVNDVRGNRQRVSALALALDTQTPQIQIEARVVEANTTFSRQFGIQWGGNALAGAAGGNATGLVFPSTVALSGANTDSNTNGTGVATPSNFAINLPAATGAGEGGALGLSLGSIAGNLNVNLRLSALEDTGNVRIISAPKITVLNGIEAKITQGTSIPIEVLSAAGTNTQFVQADLSLTVKPYVSQRDCSIAMNLLVTKNEPDFANTGARGDPTILRKEAKTTMLVADGDTTVLGGIYTRNTSVSLHKFPFLGDLPVIGWLFKNRAEEDDRTEVLVFITPKITNKASLHCQ